MAALNSWLRMHPHDEVIVLLNPRTVWQIPAGYIANPIDTSLNARIIMLTPTQTNQ
jgi:hypothetical protein